MAHVGAWLTARPPLVNVLEGREVTVSGIPVSSYFQHKEYLENTAFLSEAKLPKPGYGEAGK